MMFGRELSLPEDLLAEPNLPLSSREDYVADLVDRLQAADNFVRSRQAESRTEDNEAPPLFSPGDSVWLKAKRHPKGTTRKLQPKWQGPYKVIEACSNHMYLIDRYSRQLMVSRGEPLLYLNQPDTQLDLATQERQSEKRRNQKKISQTCYKNSEVKLETRIMELVK